MPDLRALQVYLRGLADKNPDLRKASATAIAKLRDQAAPVLDQLAERNELSPSLLPELRKIFAGLEPITDWRVLGPFPIAADAGLAANRPIDLKASFEGAGGKSRDLEDRQAGRPEGPGRPRPHLSATTTTWRPTATPRSRAPRTGRRRWPSAPTTR